jgi:hypothetical protein
MLKTSCGSCGQTDAYQVVGAQMKFLKLSSVGRACSRVGTVADSSTKYLVPQAPLSERTAASSSESAPCGPTAHRTQPDM